MIRRGCDDCGVDQDSYELVIRNSRTTFFPLFHGQRIGGRRIRSHPVDGLPLRPKASGLTSCIKLKLGALRTGF